MADKRSVQVIVYPDNNRVIRYKRDAVGNDLTAVLRWCGIHKEAVWQFDDQSFTCPHDLITEVRSDDHFIVDGPWERTV